MFAFPSQTAVSDNFDLDSKIELAQMLFKHKLYYEINRKRTFESCEKLKPYADKLVSEGYFYSGKEITHVPLGNTRLIKTFYFLTCVFCKYVHKVTSDEGKFNFDELKNAHDNISTNSFTCRMRLSNVPNRHEEVYAKNNVHEVEHKPSGALLMEKLKLADLLSEADQKNPDNKWVLCMVCREKVINVAFLPCGCALLCSSCNRFYRDRNCAKCQTKIEGYSRILIT